MKLYGYWRSGATFRVRIALNLKAIEVEHAFLNLEAGDQFSEDFDAVNPQRVVPALEDDGTILFQSLAIIQYLDETHPEPPLLPADPKGRARVRGLALIPSADAHPLIVPRVRNYLDTVFEVSEEQKLAWIRHWMSECLRALEANLTDHPNTGRFCYGDQVTLADLALVPHVAGSGMFEVPIEPYPNCKRIFDTCMELEAFKKAHPRQQPDFPQS